MTNKEEQYAYNIIMNQIENLLTKELEEFFNTSNEPPKKGNPLKEKFKKAGGKQLNMTFEEMQERNLKRMMDEIDKVVSNVECKIDTLNNNIELINKLPYFITEQEDLMEGKGIKFERVYNNDNFQGWRIEASEIEEYQIKPTVVKQSKRDALEGYKSILKNSEIDPKASVYTIARAIIDGTPIPLSEKAMGHGSFQDTIEFLKVEKARKQMQDIAESVGIIPIKIGATQPIKSKAQTKLNSYPGFQEFTDVKEALEQLQKIAEENGVLPVKSKYQTAEEVYAESKREDIPDEMGATYSLNIIDTGEYKKGAKLDDSKLPLSIVIQRQFPNALKAVAECSQFGHDKYKDLGDKDWCNLHRVDNGVERYSNAMMRHFLAAGKELDQKDNETNLEHVKHMVWNALSLLEVIEQQKL